MIADVAGLSGAGPNFTNAEHYRRVMAELPTGVVAVTGIDPDTMVPIGLVVGTFQSLSLAPPLATFSVARTSSSWPTLRRTGEFTASVLATGQQAVCCALARRGMDKLAGIAWHPSPAGNPRITGAVAWIDCRLERELDGGDHTIVVVRPLDLVASDSGGLPLLFHRGRHPALYAEPPTLGSRSP